MEKENNDLNDENIKIDKDIDNNSEIDNNLEIDDKKKDIENKFKQIENDLKNDTLSKDQLYAWFKEEMERKDGEIEKLKKENHVLFMTALKANQNKLDAMNSSTTSTKNAKSDEDDK